MQIFPIKVIFWKISPKKVQIRKLFQPWKWKIGGHFFTIFLPPGEKMNFCGRIFTYDGICLVLFLSDVYSRNLCYAHKSCLYVHQCMFLVGSPVLEIYHYIIVRNSPIVKIAVIYSSMTAEEGWNLLISIFIYVQSQFHNSFASESRIWIK